jgi:hypothetical protein
VLPGLVLEAMYSALCWVLFCENGFALSAALDWQELCQDLVTLSPLEVILLWLLLVWSWVVKASKTGDVRPLARALQACKASYTWLQFSFARARWWRTFVGVIAELLVWLPG